MRKEIISPEWLSSKESGRGVPRQTCSLGVLSNAAKSSNYSLAMVTIDFLTILVFGIFLGGGGREVLWRFCPFVLFVCVI